MVFQIVVFAALGWFYLEVLPGWLGLDTSALDVSIREIAAGCWSSSASRSSAATSPGR